MAAGGSWGGLLEGLVPAVADPGAVTADVERLAALVVPRGTVPFRTHAERLSRSLDRDRALLAIVADPATLAAALELAPAQALADALGGGAR